MKKLATNHKGFSIGQVLLVIVVLGLIGGVGYYVYQRQNQPKITNFEECKAAGNPVMESYPEQCAADGQTFTNPAQTVEEPGVTEESEKEEAEATKYVEVKQFGVKFESTDAMEKLYYEIDGDKAEFSLTTLKGTDCAADETAPVVLVKATAKELAADPAGEALKEQSQQIDGTYYYVIGAKATCADEGSNEATQAAALKAAVVKSVNASLVAID